MPKYTLDGRPIQLTTPLGKDKLLPTEVNGREAISELFQFELIALAELDTDVPFEQMLGNPVTITFEPSPGHDRYINGIVKCIERRERQLHEFVRYRLELVPKFWLLTREFRSQIFQQMSVPDILKKVLSGLDVNYQIQGDFKPREYCVQYRETDFHFACRLMEEEGIYYFFKHSESGHQMIVANTPQSHPDLPYSPEAGYEDSPEGTPQDDKVIVWFASQQIRSGKCTLWDEHFQLPYKHLDATKSIQPEAAGGSQSYQLTAGGAPGFELYEFPGEYSRHFDGINKGGGEQPDHLQWIFQENERTVNIRMQQEAAQALRVSGEGGHAGFTSGHKFTLSNHPPDDGPYVITSLEVTAKQAIGADEAEHTWDYKNEFTCIPFALPYRPQRVTPIPSVRGVQLALVVGPASEEIFTDKYGRVKVQFRWDRQGQNDANSSCWLRVGTYWAGKRWGAIHIPRIGQEVIVAFEEGDVDHPIIVGSVYNADQMPPYKLPDHKTMSGIRTRSTLKADNDMLNELRFEDKKGSEHIFMQAQKDMHLRVKNDRHEWIGDDTHLTVEQDRYEEIKRDEHTIVKRDRFVDIKRDTHTTVEGQSSVQIQKASSLEVQGDVAEKFKMNHSEDCGINLYLKAGMSAVIEAGLQLTLKVGGNFVSITPAGVTIQGTMVLINSGGAAGSGSACNLVSPTAPKEAAMPIGTQPTEKTDAAGGAGTAEEPVPGGGGGAAAPAYKKSGKGGTTEIAVSDKDKKVFIKTTMEFCGPDATEDYAKAAKKQIEDTWSGKMKRNGQDYDVVVDVTTKVNKKCSGSKDADQVIVDKKTNRMDQTLFGAGPGHQTPSAATDKDRPRRIAHEYGHTLGLDDGYVDTPTGSKPKDPNKKNDIMSETWPDDKGTLPHPHQDDYDQALKNYGW